MTPNLALVPGLEAAGVECFYIGTENGIEKSLVKDIPFYSIEAGKLRRYLSRENVSDVFRTVRGRNEALRILRELRPDLVFAKGGYVSVPVVYAAHKLKIPIVLHESDFTPGLANRLCMRKAKEICLTFDSKEAHGGKGILTGSPVRPSLLEGSAERGRGFLGFDGSRPVLLIMGGSLGAQAVNEVVDAAMDELLASYDIVHLRGRGNLNPALEGRRGYRQFEYISDELPDVFQAADIALSRAGANALVELTALQIPPLLVPLPLSASRGDQILNARYYTAQGLAAMIDQDALTPDTLIAALADLYARRDEIMEKMRSSKNLDGTGNVLAVLLNELNLPGGPHEPSGQTATET